MREASERRTVTDTDSYAFFVPIIIANERMTEAMKNQMKKFFLHSVLTSISMLLMAFAYGCGGDAPEEPDKQKPEVPTPEKPNPPQEKLPVPGLSFTSLTLPNEGDTFACIIHGLTDGEWSAKSEQSWCNVGIQANVLKISVMPNNESVKRSTTIYIIHSDQRTMGTITVNQCSLTNDGPIGNSSSAKQTFYPMFTATWCPFSPDMDRTLEEIQKRWDYQILPMRIHVKESELYNPLSVELSDLYNNTTTPTGYFENYFEVSNKHDGNVSVDYFWNLILSSTCNGNSYTSHCSYIGCKSTMSETNISAEISIKPTEAGMYRLLAFILEDNIIKAQMSKTDGEISNYCHNGVLVGSLTSTKGQELELTSSQKVISLSGSIPLNVNQSNLRLLIVLERNVAHLNYSDDCWYADNCLSVKLGKSAGNGMIENIYVGEKIKN